MVADTNKVRKLYLYKLIFKVTLYVNDKKVLHEIVGTIDVYET